MAFLWKNRVRVLYISVSLEDNFSAIGSYAVTAAFYKVCRVSFAKGPDRKGGEGQLRPKATWKTGDQGRGPEESKMLYWLAQIMGKNNG